MSPSTYKLTITERNAAVVEPVENEWGFVCPECGTDDELGSWADDGEAHLADWWQCDHCHIGGAVVRTDDPELTQNGIPVVSVG